MRNRYDEKGKLIGAHNMIFDNIPDDYEVQSIFQNEKIFDLSYLGVMKHLRTIKAGDEFDDNVFYSSEVLSHLALDYLNSARFLYQGIVADRDGNTVTYYLIPCAFLCKHSIELKIKECLISQGKKELGGHSVLKLWNQLNETDIKQYDKLNQFIQEAEKIDSNEMALRYGISKGLEPLQENFRFDIDNLITNTMYLFNVVDEDIICKYR